jgi:hypothetical protein
MRNITQIKVLVPCLLACLVPYLSAASAQAATPAAPGWAIESVAAPTSFSAGDNSTCEIGVVAPVCDSYTVTATNAGSVAANGAVTVADAVPAGLTVREIRFFWSGKGALKAELQGIDLHASCTTVPVGGLSTPVKLECTLPEFGAIEPDDTLKMVVYVTVNGSTVPGALENSASVSGGGAPEVSTDDVASPPNDVGEPAPGFGVSSFDFSINGQNGERDTQAGDHPNELTVNIGLNTVLRRDSEEEIQATSVQDVKDVVVDLPLGFVGSILAAPQCTFAELSSHINDGEGGCPQDTVVGHIATEPGHYLTSIDGPIYNMVPERGVPAEFSYVDLLAGTHVFYVHVVPTPEGYVLSTINPDIPQIALAHIVVTFYGDPAEKDHSGNANVPFFTNPTGCANGPMVAKIYMDSWQNRGSYNPDGTPDLNDPAWVSDESVSPPVTGCNALQFTPELGAQPTTQEADTPSGLEFGLKEPQPEEAGTLATPILNKAVVKLPEGMTVDPSAGDGLQACSEAQVGWNEGAAGPMKFDSAPEECPEASKIGSLELTTPLIPNKLTGALYLASQDENPSHTLLAAYIVVDDPVTGVLIKIAGRVEADPHTGRLTATFEENPQLPFSDLKLHFFGGPRASLATPEACGTFTTTSELTPWSHEENELLATPFDSFVIDAACPGGFSPSFAALSMNVQAGAYTPFDVSFQRSDTDQELQGLSVTLPPGLLADVGSVPLCGEAQANVGTCPESSQVGTVVTTVGPGPNPLQVAGKAYLTGPYNGGPYGLAVVVPAVAGPYNFGTVVVRQSLRIDPHTAQVTDVSDPFPTIIDGIPLRLRRVDVSLNRPGFTFNPTNCSKLGFNGGIAGSPLGSPRRLAGTVGYATEPGASSSFTAPFQVTNCQTLKFQPKFAVSTAAGTSRAKGASLNVKLSYPKTEQGTEADITRVKVDLPKQLPSRLTTLQKACTAKQFDTNPAGCPKESKIGYATVSTPILPLPLSGPAIFVSHGGEAFPSLIMVLQGNGVTLDLVGTTFISHAGITSSTFKTVPDAPVGSFELTLPEGKYSALAANLPAKANDSFCGQTLKMPTEFLAQNGAKINESTKISVTGCAKKKAKKKRHTARHRHTPKRGHK